MSGRQHEIFSRFRLSPAQNDGVTYRSETGGRYRLAYDRGVVPNSRPFEPPAAPAAPAASPYPRLDEDYFEWIDVLSAVWAYASAAPARPFVFAELGAGYARWSVNAICALRGLSPQAPYLVAAAEADPDHFRWMQQNLLDNDMPPERCRLFNSPVAGAKGTVHFYQGNDPAAWYGQSIVAQDFVQYLDKHPRAQRRENAYLREPGLLDRWLGAKNPLRVRAMQSVTLAEMVEGLQLIDIVDMDIQGTEADVIEHSVQLLSQRVLRLHVGTHSAEVEQRIRDAMAAAGGWMLEQDYACLGRRETPYGPVAFGDGIQSWVNVRLRG